jgi:hypothetical protein
VTPTSGKPIAEGVLPPSGRSCPRDRRIHNPGRSGPRRDFGHVHKGMGAIAEDSTTIELTRSELASITCLIRVLAPRITAAAHATVSG